MKHTAYSDAYETGRLFTLRVKLRTNEPMIIIDAFDANALTRYGGLRINVTVRQGGKVVFPLGVLTCGTAPGESADSVAAKEQVLSLVALKPGDTDPDYFDGYTPEQLEWVERNGEALSCECHYRYCCAECGGLLPCRWHRGRK